MPIRLYPHTQFCAIVEGKELRYYGIELDAVVPPGFTIGDKVKLCINTDEHGFLSPTVVLEEGMFNPLHLNGIGVVDEDGLWTVMHVSSQGGQF